MTFRNCAADARLRRIEKALQTEGHRLNATIRREDAGDLTADTIPVHDAVARLVDEASRLRPASYAGLAAKARIVVGSGQDLSQTGRVLLYSLANDLDRRDRFFRR